METLHILSWREQSIKESSYQDTNLLSSLAPCYALCKLLPPSLIRHTSLPYSSHTSLAPRPPGKLNFIDHVVGNQGEEQMTNIAEYYEKTLQFHRFWSIDDKLVSRNVLMSNEFIPLFFRCTQIIVHSTPL